MLAAGFIAKAQGGGPEEILAMIYGACFLGAFIETGISQLLGRLRRIITPLVTGTVITIIGISLIKVGITDFAGGQWLKDNNYQPHKQHKIGYSVPLVRFDRFQGDKVVAEDLLIV